MYKTAGELRAALEGVPDDMPLASRAWGGGIWKIGVDVGTVDVRSAGTGPEQEIITATDDFFRTWKGARGEPFKVVAFD
jgi:hypothetical protein